MKVCYLLTAVTLAHCQRGPERCEKCREMAVEQICLLDICPPDQGLVARRVIEVIVDGQSEWREFDIIRTFDSWEEARSYLRSENIVAYVMQRGKDG